MSEHPARCARSSAPEFPHVEARSKASAWVRRLAFGAGLCAPLLAGCRAPAPGRPEWVYPPSPRGDTVDVYHGVPVADPYRWLEDSDSPRTRAWIEAQNELTFSWLESIPARARLAQRLAELEDYDRWSTPRREGGRVFATRRSGLAEQPVLVTAESLDGPWTERVDPAELSEDGTVALASFVPSPDGRFLAYALTDGGSDWREWHVLDLESGAELPDVVRNNKFGGAQWSADSQGFFYPRYERPDGGAGELVARNQPPDEVYHRLGHPESDDSLVLPRPAGSGLSQSVELSEHRDVLVVTRWKVQTRKSEIDLVPLAPTEPEGTAGPAVGERIALVRGYDAQHEYVGDDGSVFWIQTDLDAPRGRILAIDRTHPQRESWRTVVPEAPEAIASASAVGGHLIVSYLRDATSLVKVFTPKGQLVRTVDLPGLGSAYGFRGHFDDPETFYSFGSYTQPWTLWRYDVASGESRRILPVPLPYDPSRYVTHQVFYRSKDGTRIPMFLTHAADLELNGENPTYLYGYGGFNVSLTPAFSEANLAWLELGGVLAVPNLRGGGEYGQAWHEAGTKLHKQNVFDDFIAAAEWLQHNGYTSPDKLAIGGGSNGGLLVGACLTQRPDLFAAALPAVGVMDMLRYHLFTIGWAWEGDYGTSDDPEEFRALLAYSPYHNLVPAEYPATLITTGDHDDRVVPAHSFKFAAALQYAQRGHAPCLIRIETRAGHGGGKSTSMRLQETADRWAFLVRALGME